MTIVRASYPKNSFTSDPNPFTSRLNVRAGLGRTRAAYLLADTMAERSATPLNAIRGCPKSLEHPRTLQHVMRGTSACCG